jgi:hypothetical protein
MAILAHCEVWTLQVPAARAALRSARTTPFVVAAGIPGVLR